jgi:flagellar basal body rod protein FlgC
MANNFKKNSIYGILIALVSLFMFSCNETKSGDEHSSDNIPDTDTVKALVLNVSGKLFSIPSPVQTAFLIQKSGIGYDKSILNAGNKNDQYTTLYSRALNLGVYGADLGYVSMYNQTQDALGYLAAVKQLAGALGILGAFDQQTMKQISDNIANKDSILVLVGSAYRASDAYLKTNHRTEISTLSLAGGWIESMYFSTATYKMKPNNEVKLHIAQQKATLESIIELVKSHNLPAAEELVKSLNDLKKVFDNVSVEYRFVEPTTDEAKKTTYINSISEISITQDQIDQITAKILKIRSDITNAKS